MGKDQEKFKRQKQPEQVIDFENAKNARQREHALSAVRSGKAARRFAKRRGGLFRTLCAIGFCLLFAVACVHVTQIVQLQTQRAQTQEEQADALSQKERLEQELRQADDLTYVEQQARTRLRMIKPGEILYILPEAADGDAPAAE